MRGALVSCQRTGHLGKSTARLQRLLYHTSARCDSSVDARQWVPDPTPIELLRAAVISSPSLPSPFSDHNSFDRHARTVGLLDQEWKLGLPPASLWPALKRIRPPVSDQPAGRLSLINDVNSLKSFIEEIVIDTSGSDELQFDNCQQIWLLLQRLQLNTSNAELGALVMDIISRLKRLNLKVRSAMYEIGMYYSAIQLSIPTFQHFFTQWKHSGNPTMYFGGEIIEGLYHAAHAKQFTQPSYDTSTLLKMITGEGVPGRNLKNATAVHDKFLAGIRQDEHHMLYFLLLLTTLQSDVFLYRLWDKFTKKASSWDSNTFFGAYRVVGDLIKTQRPETALDFLESLSKQCDNTLPHITSSPILHTLTDHPVLARGIPSLLNDTDYEILIQKQLQSMERRLGLTWQSEIHSHRGIPDPASNDSQFDFTERPLFTIDGDSCGYEDMSRLCPEIVTRGCSKSIEDLGHVAALLQEMEGNEQLVMAEAPKDLQGPNRVTTALPHFRWRPQLSPIEFTGSLPPKQTDQTQTWSPASLGLLRARRLVKGELSDTFGCLHLLQLGYLEMQDENGTWQLSGYIVAWDRHLGQFIAFHVGKSAGVLDVGPVSLEAPFGTVLLLSSDHMPELLHQSSDPHFRNFASSYYIEVDPGHDLDSS